MNGNKYRAQRTEVNGTSYDSKREAAVCEQLKMLARRGAIFDLVLQPKFPIKVNDILITTYTADASYNDKDGFHVVDIKSPPTAKERRFVLVRKLMKAVHGIDIEVIS